MPPPPYTPTSPPARPSVGRHGWAVVVKTAAAIFFASLLVALISSSLAVILILALSVATLHVRDHSGGRVMLDTDAPLVAAGTSVAVCALLLTHGAQLLRWMLQWEPVALDFFLSPTAPFHTTHIWCWRALFLVLTHIGLLEMSPLLRRVALGDLVKLSALHEAMKSQGIL